MSRKTAAILVLLLARISAPAEPYTVHTPGGSFTIDITHAGPDGSLIEPQSPTGTEFHPPSIFSAPLPSGSGARALGLAGAFTAVADDATAASWNPAGLIHLQSMEASAVYRFDRREYEFQSHDAGFQPPPETDHGTHLNYLSAVYPLKMRSFPVVFSLNIQEAYDFRQDFSVSLKQNSSRPVAETRFNTYPSTQTDYISNATARLTLTSHLTTDVRSALDQLLWSGLDTDLTFRQQGIIAAATPSAAIQLAPNFSVGLSINVYRDNMLGGNPIETRIAADYRGNSSQAAEMLTRRETQGYMDIDGVREVGGGSWGTIQIPFSYQEDIPPFSDSSTAASRSDWDIIGRYEEHTVIESLEGVNLTLGALWNVTRRGSLGLAVDLPWTAKAEQEKTVYNRITTIDRYSGRMINETATSTTDHRSIEMNFPLYVSAGMVWRWTDRCYTSVDLGYTGWSDFWYQAEGAERINPLDGTPHGQHALDDCFSARYGMEYLLLFKKVEVPLRGGVFYEERPAVGSPDIYRGFTLGSGLSSQVQGHKLMLDVAYQYRKGESVMGSLVPGQSGLNADTTEHQVFLSAVIHL